MSKSFNISSMLSQGDIGSIARKLGLSPGAVSAAIKRANPGHPAVRMALFIAKESGAIEAAQTLAAIDIAA